MDIQTTKWITSLALFIITFSVGYTPVLLVRNAARRWLKRRTISSTSLITDNSFQAANLSHSTTKVTKTLPLPSPNSNNSGQRSPIYGSLKRQATIDAEHPPQEDITEFFQATSDVNQHSKDHHHDHSAVAHDQSEQINILDSRWVRGTMFFGGGVLMATAFCHLIPETHDNFNAYLESTAAATSTGSGGVVVGDSTTLANQHQHVHSTNEHDESMDSNSNSNSAVDILEATTNASNIEPTNYGMTVPALMHQHQQIGDHSHTNTDGNSYTHNHHSHDGNQTGSVLGHTHSHSSNIPYVEIAVCCGFFFIYLVEQIMIKFLDGHSHEHGPQMASSSTKTVALAQQSPVLATSNAKSESLESSSMKTTVCLKPSTSCNTGTIQHRGQSQQESLQVRGNLSSSSPQVQVVSDFDKQPPVQISGRLSTCSSIDGLCQKVVSSDVSIGYRRKPSIGNASNSAANDASAADKTSSITATTQYENDGKTLVHLKSYANDSLTGKTTLIVDGYATTETNNDVVSDLGNQSWPDSQTKHECRDTKQQHRPYERQHVAPDGGGTRIRMNLCNFDPIPVDTDIGEKNKCLLISMTPSPDDHRVNDLDRDHHHSRHHNHHYNNHHHHQSVTMTGRPDQSKVAVAVNANKASADHQGHSSPLPNASSASSSPATTNSEVFKFLRGLIIVSAFSAHAIFDGVTIGSQQTNENVWAIFLAIACHKLPIAAVVGLELFDATLKSNLWTCVHLAAFSIMSPIGIWLVVVAQSSLQLNVDHPVMILLQAFATGTIIYIIFVEILQPKGHNAHKDGIMKSLCLILGFIFMLAILTTLGHGE